MYMLAVVVLGLGIFVVLSMMAWGRAQCSLERSLNDYVWGPSTPHIETLQRRAHRTRRTSLSASKVVSSTQLPSSSHLYVALSWIGACIRRLTP